MALRLIALLGAGVLALAGAASGREAAAWKRGAPLPVPRSEVAAATFGNELVVAGGFLADGRSSRRVDAYSPARNRWRRLPDLPAAVNHAMAASDGRRLYVVGGYGAPRRASVFSSGQWRGLPALPEPRAAAGAAIVGRTLYVIGGVAEGGLAQTSLAFDLKTRRWTRVPGPKPRDKFCSTPETLDDPSAPAPKPVPMRTAVSAVREAMTYCPGVMPVPD